MNPLTSNIDIAYNPFKNEKEGLTMTGTIRCSKCHSAMPEDGICLSCNNNLKCYIMIYWQGKHEKFTQDKDRHPLGYLKAKRLLESMRSKIDDNNFDPGEFKPQKIEEKLFENLIEKWLEEKEDLYNKGEFAYSTLCSYRSVVKKNLSYFNKMDVRQIKKQHLKEFDSYLVDRGIVLRSTKVNIFSILKTFLEWVIEDFEGTIIKALPMFPKIEGELSQPKTYMEFDEQQKALDKLPLQYKDIISFGMELGLRRSEICALSVGNVDFQERIVKIERTFSGGKLHNKTKQKRIEVLPLSDTALEIAKRNIKDKLPGQFLFLNKHNRPFVAHTVKWAWNKYTGLDITLHEALRHSYINQLINAGMNMPDIQFAARHSSINTTQRYFHKRVGDIRERLNQRGKIIPIKNDMRTSGNEFEKSNLS